MAIQQGHDVLIGCELWEALICNWAHMSNYFSSELQLGHWGWVVPDIKYSHASYWQIDTWFTHTI